MPESLDLRNAPAGSTEWWLSRLLARLAGRRPDLETFEAYYDGHSPSPSPPRSSATPSALGSASNFMSLVVDAPGERLEVQGFRFADAEGDEDIWRRVWQANDLDAGSQLAHTEALMKGVAYALVEPQAVGVPVVTVENALDCIVEVPPKDRRERVAALKRWVDDEGHLVAYVHLPDAVYKYRSLGKAQAALTSDLPTGELALDVEGHYMATADLAEDSYDVGFGHRPQEAVRGALTSLAEPCVSETARAVGPEPEGGDHVTGRGPRSAQLARALSVQQEDSSEGLGPTA